MVDIGKSISDNITGVDANKRPHNIKIMRCPGNGRKDNYNRVLAMNRKIILIDVNDIVICKSYDYKEASFERD